MKLKDKLTDLFSEDEEEVKKPKEEINWKEYLKKLDKNYTYYLLLIPVLLFSLWIRLRNMPLLKGKYLMGLDPYLFYRKTAELLTYGHILPIDLMRSPPIGKVVHFDFFIYFLAGWTKLVHLILGKPQIYAHIIYPAVIGVVGFFFFFLFVRSVFGNKVAIVSTALLSVAPAYLYRTMAGFADHEALAMMFMFAALWLFAEFIKENNTSKKLILASLAGFTASLMALTWSAVPMLTIPIALFITIEILFEKINKKSFIGYILWALLFYLPIILLQGIDQLKRINIIIPLFPLLTLFIYYGLKKLKVLKTKRISLGFQANLISIILSLALGELLFKIHTVLNIILHPAEQTGRVAHTISEIIGSINLWKSFSWVLLLGIFGLLFLIYFTFEKNKKEIIILEIFGLISIYILLLTSFSNIIRIFGFSLFLIVLIILYIFEYHTKQEKNNFSKNNRLLYLLPLFLFLTVSYLSKTGARFVFVFAPAITLMAGYFLVSISKELFKRKNLKIFVILIVLIFVAIFFINARTSALTAKNTGSHLPGQWENSMLWIKNNTPENSVIAHWWDYGYWTQAVADRPSIKDGGTHGEYELFLLGRYGMTAFNDTKALTYFKTHNTSYLLYSSEEIGKYHAFSYIGSNKNYDRESTIGVFSLVQQKEVRNGTINIYQGGWSFDQDIAINNLVLPKNKAGIGAFLITTDKNNKIIEAPKAIIIYNGQQIEDNISCVYTNGKKQTWNVTSNLNGCIVFTPYFKSQTQGINNGGILYLSPKVYPGLFARLYILNQKVDGFEEVYNDKMPLALYLGRIVGPIRIWKINYPENIKTNETFLKNTTHKDPEFRLS